jgi:hypothetical protein
LNWTIGPWKRFISKSSSLSTTIIRQNDGNGANDSRTKQCFHYSCFSSDSVCDSLQGEVLFGLVPITC